MRQGQHSRRPRSRGRRQQNPGNRVYDSNGPDVRVRGTASTVAEKYMSLSLDAQSSGDRIAAENYLQHAEHYLRILAATKSQKQPASQPAAANPSPEAQAKIRDGSEEESSEGDNGSSRRSTRTRRPRPYKSKDEDTGENRQEAEDGGKKASKEQKADSETADAGEEGSAAA